MSPNINRHGPPTMGRANRLACLVSLIACLLVATQLHAKVTSFDQTVSSHEESKELKAHLVELTAEPAAGGEETKQSSAHGSHGKDYTPVIFWHGMGDTAYGSINLERLALAERFPGMRVFSVQIGHSSAQDAMAGYFTNVNKQVDLVCDELLRNEAVREARAFNAVGFSQGGQFLRALIQRCPYGAHGIWAKNLITLGGQHQGVFGLPRCLSSTWCDYIRYMLSTGAYRDYVQEHLVQAEYWHDPMKEAEYKAKNVFLPDVNNENKINSTYRHNLMSLQNMVLVKFEQDEMVVPRESSHFGFYEPGQNKRVMPLHESPLYLEDRLGLRHLNEDGRLLLVSVPGKHLQYKMSWFMDQIADKYLDN